MFSQSFSRMLLLAGLLLLPLAGCQRGSDQFANLDVAPKDGVLSADELDVNRDGTVSPDELQYKHTYTRRLEQFLADGGSTDDRELTPAEFDRALLGHRMPWWMIAIIVAVVVAVPVPLGFQLGKNLHMPDHGWKIALILLTITAAATITYFGWPPKRGIDLSGGVVLIYEIDEEATVQQGVADGGAAGQDGDAININEVVAALRRRINPGGVKEIVIRPYGSRQVEIVIPEIETAEVDYIKEIIGRTGQLEFLIVANSTDHRDMISQALSPELLPLRERTVPEAGGWKGRWVPVGVEERQRGKEPSYHGISLADVLRGKLRGSEEFSTVSVPRELQGEINNESKNLKQVLDQLGYKDVQVLMVLNPEDRFNIKGQHLARASKTYDGSLNPAVSFTMKPAGAALLGRLTGENLPDKTNDFYRRMGIVMDGELISAPRLLGTIDTNGQITGNFTDQEVDFLVGILRAGRLPAVLRKEPVSENQVSALLGGDTIRQGAIAITASLVITLVFMLYYYRFAGMVACMALLLNLLFTIAMMISLRAAFTLPGIAGLVLGVGMSVDANILIFERIREEMERGAGLRMAIRNGFARAATTIVDSNMTTLITAVVLYAIGTEQIRGFAVTLILGLIISMYTAIFCAHVVFEIAERRRWITQLKMVQWISRTNFDFIGKQGLAVGASVLIMVLGLGAVIARGRGIFDIDFNGGTSVQMLLAEPQRIEDVRAAIEESKILGDVSISEIGVEGQRAGTVYQIDSSVTGEEPPQVGDPVTFVPPGASNASTFKVASVDNEAQTAELVSEGSDARFPSVKWTNFQRDGVRIVQDEIRRIFGDKLEQRSLKISDISAATGSSSGTGTREVPGATLPGEEDLTPDTSAETPATDEPDTEPAIGETPPATGETPAEEPATEEPATTEPADETPPATEPDPETPSAEASEEDGAAEEAGEATPPAEEPSNETPAADDSSALNRALYVFTSLQDETTPTEEGPATETPATAAEPPAETEEPAAGEDETATPPATTEVPAETGPATGEVEETTGTPDVVAVRVGRTTANLEFGHDVSAATVTAAVKKAAANVTGLLDLPGVRLGNKDWNGSPGQRFKNWEVELPLDQPTATRVLEAMQNDLTGSPVWLSSNKIGPQIAGNLREVALASLVFSTLGIVAYIWFRFHHAVFGVAAVIAMLHDVIITVGAIGFSYYLAQFMGFLGIDEFKINMTVVAAILTVIGFSLNDTVVVFDRIREVRGKNPDLTVAMVNQSVNQTLSRTLLTSFTTILSLFAMYIIGGPSIRGFAFTLLVGILVGTFSSIYIASPCLLWLMKVTKQTPNRGEKPEKSSGASNASTLRA